MLQMKWVKGEHYDHLLEEFLKNGGDISECPFDTKNKIGSDSDSDPVIDEVWDDIVAEKIKLEGEVVTEEEWLQWEREYQEIIKRKLT